jgi:hypothetical protein
MIAVLTVGLLAGAAAQQSPAKAPAPPAARVEAVELPGPSLTGMGLQGYSVVLVVGDMQGAGGGGETVPAAARKALSDMQAFLPYKRYQLLDASWMVCCGGGHAIVNGRLRGPEDREYSYAIDTVGGNNGKLTVRFWMREGDISTTPVASSSRVSAQTASLSDTARAEYSRQLYEAQKERDEAELQQRRAKQMLDVGTMAEPEYQLARRKYQLAVNRVEELERTLGARNSAASTSRGNLLDSTFSIAIGETVVIGTSRLKGDQALIALLTAAGKTGAAK